MIDLLTVPSLELNQTTRLLQNEFKLRGWSAVMPYIGSPHCFVDRGDGQELHIFTALPPTTSYAAAHLANDKYATHQLLERANITQLETVLVDEDLSLASELMSKWGKVVVKPVDGSHGKGITVNVADENALQLAVEYALQFTSTNKKAIVQRQFTHDSIHDIRILCIDYKYTAALMRVPARVFGDGILTIRELIDKENASPNRGEPYRAPLATIDIDRAVQFLGEKIHTIPGIDEEVGVLGVANYGAGGELIDLTDDMPEWLIDQAIRAAKVSGLVVAGIDFMSATIPTIQQPMSDDTVIVEINKCPSLAIHDQPTFGKPRGAVKTYVDYLATI